MRLALPSLLLFLYITTSFIAPLPLRTGAKLAAVLAVFAICMKYPAYDLIGGSFIAPNFPQALLVAMEVLFASAVILFALLLIKDALNAALWLSRLFGASWRLPVAHATLAAWLAAAALVLGSWGMWQSISPPIVRTVDVAIPNLPRELDGFSIAQLSDLHIGPFLGQRWLRGVVEQTNALHPDAVVITGDMIDGTTAEIGDQLAPIGDLRAARGVFGVTGNHEYYFDADAWTGLFEGLGVTMLRNEHRVLTVGGAALVVAGVPDQTDGRIGGDGPQPALAFQDAPDAPRLLLAHRPAGAGSTPGVDLQLSGHTHGGNTFFLAPLIDLFNGGWVDGLYETNGAWLYVSPGTGIWSGFSCRIGVPAEITRIVLRS